MIIFSCFYKYFPYIKWDKSNKGRNIIIQIIQTINMRRKKPTMMTIQAKI